MENESGRLNASSTEEARSPSQSGAGVYEANLGPTAILNYTAPSLKALVDHLGHGKPTGTQFVRAAHAHLQTLNAVYSIEEGQSAAETIRRNAGSCSQRIACLEALARGYGVGTRVRALWLDRSFWSYRLPLLEPVLPERTLMPWPQFHLGGRWVDFDELYGTPEELASGGGHPFTNRGESLFDAVTHVPVDFLGKLKETRFSSFDISKFVVSDGGMFDTRDRLVASLDKTTWLGKLVFAVIYGGRAIRRLPD
jgi:hypothetical protein